MPNHIKNRLEFRSKEDAEIAINLFSTFHPKIPKRSYDGNLVYEKDNDYGWWDENNHIFNQRGKQDLNQIPNGFKQIFEDEWNQFPDFNKIIPMPEGLDITDSSSTTTWVKILFGLIDFKSAFASRSNNMGEEWINNGFDSIMNQMEASSALKLILGEYGITVKDMSDKDFDNLIQGIRNQRDYGYITWYDWSNDYWGTKWNSYQCEKINDTTYEFQTAWSNVSKLMDKIADQLPQIKFTYKWSDEDTGCNCGIIEYAAGEKIKIHDIENSSNEAYELAFELWPEDKQYYEFVDGKYRYKEEEEV